MSRPLTIVVLVAGLVGPASRAQEPEPPDAAAARVGLVAIEQLASRAAAELSGRTAFEVEPPPVAAADAASRRAHVAGRWREAYPWLGDEARDLLGALGLVDVRFDVGKGLDGLGVDDPAILIHAGRILVPEEMGRGLLADELLQAVGLSSLELRLVAEMARAMAASRLEAGGGVGSPDARAARWCLAEGYARLVVLDVLLRAGGVTAQDAGVGLLGLETSPAALAPHPDLVLALPESVTDHLTGGPEDAMRFLIGRLLAGGWPAVDAVLDGPIHGFAALDPSSPSPGPAARDALTLGPRHLLAALGQRAVPEEQARALASRLRRDEASRPRAGFWTWRLVFAAPEDARALAAAWGTAPGPSVTVSGAEALLLARSGGR